MFIAREFRLSATEEMRSDFTKIRYSDDRDSARRNVAGRGMWSDGGMLVRRCGNTRGKNKNQGVFIKPENGHQESIVWGYAPAVKIYLSRPILSTGQ